MPGYRSRTRKAKAAKARKGKPSAKRKTRKPKPAFDPGLDHLTNPEPAVHADADQGQEGPAEPSPGTSPLGARPSLDLGASAADSASHEREDTEMAERLLAEALANRKKLSKRERREVAWNLRVAGHGYREIAEHLGVSHKTAYYDVQEAATYLREHTTVIAEDTRAIFVSRGEAMISYLWPRVETGDTFAVREVRGIMQDICKMLGLNAPVEVDVNVRRPFRDAKEEDLHELLTRLKTAVPLAQRAGDPVLPFSKRLSIIDGTTGRLLADADLSTDPDTDDPDTDPDTDLEP